MATAALAGSAPCRVMQRQQQQRQQAPMQRARPTRLQQDRVQAARGPRGAWFRLLYGQCGRPSVTLSCTSTGGWPAACRQYLPARSVARRQQAVRPLQVQLQHQAWKGQQAVRVPCSGVWQGEGQLWALSQRQLAAVEKLGRLSVACMHNGSPTSCSQLPRRSSWAEGACSQAWPPCSPRPAQPVQVWARV